MPDIPTTCAGCGLKEDHKMCIAHGTDAYMNPEHPAWGNAEFIAALRELLAARQDRDNARKLIDQWVASDKRARAAAAKVLPAAWLAESVPGEGDEPGAAEIVEELVEQIAALRQQLAAASGPRLYLDCDGVLADFDAAFIAKFGHTPRDYEERHGAEIFWRDIHTEAPTFYRDLPLMPDARKLFDAVKHLRPIILTGCPRGGWAEMQKLAWAAEHFPGTPMVVCFARDKSKYLQPGDILIDDRTQYRDKWEAAGGVFIHHTSADESIESLRQQLAAMRPVPPVAKPSEAIVVDGRVCVFERTKDFGACEPQGWYIRDEAWEYELRRDGQWYRGFDSRGVVSPPWPTEQAARDFAKSVSMEGKSNA